MPEILVLFKTLKCRHSFPENLEDWLPTVTSAYYCCVYDPKDLDRIPKLPKEISERLCIDPNHS